MHTAAYSTPQRKSLAFLVVVLAFLVVVVDIAVVVDIVAVVVDIVAVVVGFGNIEILDWDMVEVVQQEQNITVPLDLQI